MADKPVWVEQWPLTSEIIGVRTARTGAAKHAKHIEESTSPGNSPIFVI